MSSDKSILLKLRYLQEEFNDTERLFSEYNKGFMEDLKKALKERGISEDKDPMLSAIKKDKQKQAEKSQAIENDDLEEENPESKEEAEEGPEDVKDDVADKNDENLRPEIKKLYRTIVQSAHPDKHPAYFKEREVKRMTTLYTRCVEGAKSNDLFLILDCASALYMDIPELTEEDIDNLRQKAVSLEEDIKVFKDTYPWIWGLESTQKAKDSIVESYIANKI